MPLDVLYAHKLQIVAPQPHHVRHEAFLQEHLEPFIDQIKVSRVDALEVLIPGVSGGVAAARVEGGNIAGKGDGELDHVEALGPPVVGQPLEAPGEVEPLGHAVPPGVGQPEKGRTVGVLQVVARFMNTQGSVDVHRVAAGVGGTVMVPVWPFRARSLLCVTNV